MAEITQEVYQDNGFELVVYLQRKADPFKTCPTCGRKLFPVASIYDEWQEGSSSNIEYDHCAKCQHILQVNIRRRVGDKKNTNQQIHKMPPHEMVLQLLAHARHIQGRGITRLTINRKWWQAWRYPLVMGDQLATRVPRVRPTGEPQISSNLQDSQALHTTPLPRYKPRNQPRHNPFTSRRVGQGEEAEILKEEAALSPNEVAEDLDQIDNTPEND